MSNEQQIIEFLLILDRYVASDAETEGKRHGSHAFKEIKQMSDYIFVISNLDMGSGCINGADIAKVLLDNDMWLFSPVAPYLNDYKRGDRCLIYLAGAGNRMVIANATVQEGIREATSDEKHVLTRLGLGGFSLTLEITNICRWSIPLQLGSLVNDLTFIGLKKYWGQYFRQAAKRIPKVDFDLILSLGNQE